MTCKDFFQNHWAKEPYIVYTAIIQHIVCTAKVTPA